MFVAKPDNWGTIIIYPFTDKPALSAVVEVFTREEVINGPILLGCPIRYNSILTIEQARQVIAALTKAVEITSGEGKES